MRGSLRCSLGWPSSPTLGDTVGDTLIHNQTCQTSCGDARVAPYSWAQDNPMKTYSVISSLILAVVASGVPAQDLPKPVEPAIHRPLNLSVRKPAVPVVDLVVLPVGDESKPTTQTPPASVSNEVVGAPPSAMPYGAGYETRQQGVMVAGRGPGPGTGGNGTGSGPGGGGGAGGRGGPGPGHGH